MTGAFALAALFVTTLVVQALLPARRILVVATGAGLSLLACEVSGVAETGDVLRGIPWDVLVILVSLGLLSEVFVLSRVFGRAAVSVAEWSRVAPTRLAVLVAVAMYLVSGLVNNLTALLLVLPVLLTLLRLLAPSARYVRWTLGILLTACNLGGAATPIGDFPAILLLGRGTMPFREYLVLAFPPTLLALAVLLAGVAWGVRPARDMPVTPMAQHLTVTTIQRLYRGVHVDRDVLVPAAGALGAMLVAWAFLPLPPELVALLGALAALLSTGARGEAALRTRVDVEATLFLFCLFVMVGSVRATGLFADLAAMLLDLPIGDAPRLLLFLLIAGLSTGVFSAGPSMAAMLEVADSLVGTYGGPAVYVGLALAVCAGSSLFLTAATSGPLAQAMVERAELRDRQGRTLSFGLRDHLVVGLSSFAVILSVAFGAALLYWRG